MIRVLITITLVVVLATLSTILAAVPGNAQTVAQLNASFSKPEIDGCKMVRGRSFTNLELQILLTVGLNELAEIPYLTFRTVESIAESIMLDSSDYPIRRTGYLTQFYICGFPFPEANFTRHIYANGRLLDNAAAVLGGILSDLHVSIKALEPTFSK